MNKNKKRRGFTLVELLVVLLILGVLVGLAVPRYMEFQKAARARTFAANVRQIVSALEAYKADHMVVPAGQKPGYPASLADLKTNYFTQEPINPYTGVSMLTGTPCQAGIQYVPVVSDSGNWDYELNVLQEDVDNVDNDDTTTTLCEAIPTMLPTMACSQTTISCSQSAIGENYEYVCDNKYICNSDLLDDFTYESRIDGFTPNVLCTSVRTTTDWLSSATVIKTTLEQPPEIVYANYKMILFSFGNSDAENITKETFGDDNVIIIADIFGLAFDILFNIEEAITPTPLKQSLDPSLDAYGVYGPFGIILDEDGTLLAVFDWLASSLDENQSIEDQLYTIATLGKGYSGVYDPPIPILCSSENGANHLTLLSNQQKMQIRDALKLIYPDIKTNVDYMQPYTDNDEQTSGDEQTGDDGYVCENENFSDLLVSFTYESRIDGFTPCVLSATEKTVEDPARLLTATLVKTVLRQPPNIVYANYKSLVLAPNNPWLEGFFDDDNNEIVNLFNETFGENNVTVLNTSEDLNYTAYTSIVPALSLFNSPPAGLPTGPIGIILDEDGTLLAIFDWYWIGTKDSDELLTIATIGKGYSGVYVPVPAYGFYAAPEDFMLLTDQRKEQIRDALLPVYPGIRTNVD